MSQCRAVYVHGNSKRIEVYLLPLSLACMLSLLASGYIAPAAWVSMSILNLQMQPHAHISHRDQAGITEIYHEPGLIYKYSSLICGSNIRE